MQALLLDAENKRFKRVDIEDDWRILAKSLNCEYVEIVHRYIGKKPYTIICDDAGAKKDNPIPSAYNSYGDVVLFGNLLFFSYSPGEELEALADDDFEYLKQSLTTITVIRESCREKIPVVINVGK